jgi:hypothetical protein
MVGEKQHEQRVRPGLAPRPHPPKIVTGAQAPLPPHSAMLFFVALYRQPLAATRTATLKDLATILGRHALAEAMGSYAFALLWLPCALHQGTPIHPSKFERRIIIPAAFRPAKDWHIHMAGAGRVNCS